MATCGGQYSKENCLDVAGVSTAHPWAYKQHFSVAIGNHDSVGVAIRVSPFCAGFTLENRTYEVREWRTRRHLVLFDCGNDLKECRVMRAHLRYQFLRWRLTGEFCGRNLDVRLSWPFADSMRIVFDGKRVGTLRNFVFDFRKGTRFGGKFSNSTPILLVLYSASVYVYHSSNERF